MTSDRFTSSVRWIEDHITVAANAVAAGGAAVALLVAPEVSQRDDIEALAPFFSSSAQVLATLLVALALFQGSSLIGGHGGRRFISVAAFAHIGIGLVTAMAGLSESLPNWLYQWLFAIVVGAGTSGLASTLLVGGGNLTRQREDAITEQARRLGGDRPKGGG